MEGGDCIERERRITKPLHSRPKMHSMTNSRFLSLLLMLLPMLVIAAVEADDKQVPRSPEEAALIHLIGEMSRKYQSYYAEAEEMADAEEQSEYLSEHDPGKVYVPKLLDVEQRHTGTLIGLMALRKVIHKGAANGELNSPLAESRRKALKRLLRYGDFAELPEVLRYLDAGSFEPRTEAYLRQLIDDRNATAANREFGKLMLARWIIGVRDSRESFECRLREIAAGAELAYPNEMDHLSEWLNNLPNEGVLKKWEQEATAILKSLIVTGREYRQPAIQKVDPEYYLVKFDPERTKLMPRLSEIAEGMLFKEDHLRLGKIAPDLDVPLLSGYNWSLAEQRGKVVIIQFSYEGCGPCEAMYPDLREIQQEPNVVILGIMADEQRAMTEQAVAEGKLTWAVHWDGWRGPVATRWAVIGFPTVYVIDARGEVAGIDLRGNELVKKVEELSE